MDGWSVNASVYQQLYFIPDGKARVTITVWEYTPVSQILPSSLLLRGVRV